MTTRTILRGVEVIDGLGEATLGPLDLVIDGERIGALAPPRTIRREAANAVAIDAGGLTALPGLIDAHCHYTFDPTEGSLQTIARRSDEEILAAAARHAGLALRAGVTSARGAGSIRGLEWTLRDRIARGDVEGPRLIAAGLAVGGIDGHGAAFGLEGAGREAVAAITNEVIDRGADVVKIVASEAAMLTTTGHAPGRMVFGRPELTLAELRAIVERAHARGRRVMAHAQDSESVVRCAAAGVDSIEHAWLADEAAIETMARHGTTLVPTLGVTDVNRTLGGLTSVQRERQDLIERTHRASTAAAVRLGVPLVTGTDTGEVGVTADHVWREVALLIDHGATPMRAIRAATSEAARLLGIDGETGTLETGKLADIILVDGDPTRDVGVLGRPRAVFQAGRAVDLEAARAAS